MKTLGLSLAIILIPVFLLSGCHVATYEYTSSPAASTVEAGEFTARFTPEKGDASYYSWFRLDVENKSHVPITIDWNKTRYLQDGKSAGAFIWVGIDPDSLRTNTVPGDEIPAGQSFSKEISPQATVALAGRKDYGVAKERSTLYNGVLPGGKNGILLSVTAEGRLIQKRLEVTITEIKK